MIGIIDCGGANLKSLTYALERIKLKYRISKVWSDLSNSRALILPGVSAAGNVMSNIRKLALEDRIRDFNKPVLGICVGMQVLYEHSDEDGQEGAETDQCKLEECQHWQCCWVTPSHWCYELALLQ